MQAESEQSSEGPEVILSSMGGLLPILLLVDVSIHEVMQMS